MSQSMTLEISSTPPPLKRKVTAFVLRARIDGMAELLVHSTAADPGLPWRLPAGGVYRKETPEEALLRELMEETGLQHFVVVRELGRRRVSRGSMGTHIERRDFLLHVPPSTPDAWDHTVTGKGGDAGQIFRFRWVSSHELERIEGKQARWITPDYVPELFQGCRRAAEDVGIALAAWLSNWEGMDQGARRAACGAPRHAGHIRPLFHRCRSLAAACPGGLSAT